MKKLCRKSQKLNESRVRLEVGRETILGPREVKVENEAKANEVSNEEEEEEQVQPTVISALVLETRRKQKVVDFLRKGVRQKL